MHSLLNQSNPRQKTSQLKEQCPLQAIQHVVSVSIVKVAVVSFSVTRQQQSPVTLLCPFFPWIVCCARVTLTIEADDLKLNRSNTGRQICSSQILHVPENHCWNIVNGEKNITTSNRRQMLQCRARRITFGLLHQQIRHAHFEAKLAV